MALLAPLLTVIASAMSVTASATEDPAQPGATCERTETTACLQARLPTGVEVPGIAITVTLPSGGETVIETDESGVAVLEVTEEGQYSLTIDTDSFPDGVELQPNATETITPTISLGGQANITFNVRADDYTGAESWVDQFAQASASGLRLGLLLALAAVGLSLIYGTTGLSSFSHAEQVTLGGMVCYMLVSWAGMPFLLAAVLTVVLCGATGLAQDMAIWRPLRRRGLGLIQMMIVTIGLSLAMQYAFQVFVGAGSVRILTQAPQVTTFGPITLTQQSFWAMGISIVVLVAVGFALQRTRLGRATRAVSDNPALAAASGIDVDRVVRIVWVVATALAGLAGIMLALILNGVKWDSGMQILLLLFAAVTLGGLGTAFGALIGAIVIGFVVELTPVFGLPGDLKYATALLILILLLMVRPQGILGKAERVG
ncbi:branched-chain amino acid ABC transporter permease [Nocardioides massiliensis]|uniref:Branched-chain amino acid transport system permease protein n=1 Tax=Nocardioides massiliensis TaxID=1325935 RepID=A0ABT9NTE0_9ACTN|nr:branched-chain amino acid ABC transporter permease [Nocardioides massiliensis]MDP9823469.1 branched-chain amino acid transport system permease protein [Nocardioides massiliensis]